MSERPDGSTLKRGDRVRVLSWKTMQRKYGIKQREKNWVDLPGAFGFLAEMRPLCGQTATVTRDEDTCGQVIKVKFDDAELDHRFNRLSANYGFTSWMFTKIKTTKEAK